MEFTLNFHLKFIRTNTLKFRRAGVIFIFAGLGIFSASSSRAFTARRGIAVFRGSARLRISSLAAESNERSSTKRNGYIAVIERYGNG